MYIRVFEEISYCSHFENSFISIYSLMEGKNISSSTEDIVFSGRIENAKVNICFCFHYHSLIADFSFSLIMFERIFQENTALHLWIQFWWYLYMICWFYDEEFNIVGLIIIVESRAKVFLTFYSSPFCTFSLNRSIRFRLIFFNPFSLSIISMNQLFDLVLISTVCWNRCKFDCDFSCHDFLIDFWSFNSIYNFCNNVIWCR